MVCKPNICHGQWLVLAKEFHNNNRPNKKKGTLSSHDNYDRAFICIDVQMYRCNLFFHSAKPPMTKMLFLTAFLWFKLLQVGIWGSGDFLEPWETTEPVQSWEHLAA